MRVVQQWLRLLDYIDDDLTGTVELDEVRTGFFLLYTAIELPGFDLENVPTKQDLVGGVVAFIFQCLKNHGWG